MSAIPEQIHETQSSEFQFTSERQVFFALLIIASGLLFFYKSQKKSRFVTLGDKIPGPRALPIFGNALVVLGKSPTDIVKHSLELAELYGDVARGWLGSKLIVFLMNPADAVTILNSNVHIDKSAEYDFFKPWLGEGLLISTGNKWRSHRKIIAPTFHINILKSFIGVFNQNSHSVIEKMRSEIGKTFDVHDYMSGVTVDILLETVMGITRRNQGEGTGFEYAMAVMKMCDIIHQRHYKWWLRPECVFKFSSLSKKQTELLNIIHGLTNQVIKSKKEEYLSNKAKGIIHPTIEELTRETNDSNKLESDNTTNTDNVFSGYNDDLDFIDENDVGEKKRLAFLDLMVQSAQNGTNDITDLDIKEEVDTIMFEGHDTTAAGSSFVLCILGVHQEVQAKAYNELYEIFGDSDRAATFNDTVRMKYLERVILETLRLFPPVPVIARLLKHDVQINTNDFIIPAGTTVVISQYKIHRNPKYYKYPNVFNPDNFLPENAQSRNYYSYIPFSAGPRSCVGRKYAMLKLKVLLSTILRNYKITSDIPEENFELVGDIILKRADGFRIKIEPRRRTPKTKQT